MNYDPKQDFDLKDHMTDKSFVIIYARDWQHWDKEQYVSEVKDFKPAYAWMAGSLMEDKKDCLVIAFEYFKECPDGPSIRHINCIPKENILYVKIIGIEEIK